MWLWRLVMMATVGECLSVSSLGLSSLGKIGLLGDFRGISVSEYATEYGYTQDANNANMSLFLGLSSNVFVNIEESDGVISDLCVIDNHVYVGGNFTRFANQQLRSVADVNIDTGEIVSLGDGIEGSVSAVFCDDGLVYFGGSFADHVAVYNTTSQDWIGAPKLHGGHVNAITRFNDSIVLGGKFDGLGNGTYTDPDAQLQLVNLKSATITSTNSGDDPSSIICSNSTWKLTDGSQGSWTASLPYSITPKALVMRNSGTKIFRFVSNGGIMNLTYTSAGSVRYCDAWCPLNNTAESQEFTFVNQIQMSQFSIELLDYYGEAAGLQNLEIYQEAIVTYAIEAYNEPIKCGKSATSRSTLSGKWSSSTSTYLTSNSTTSNSPSVTFLPSILVSGNYTVFMYTPGCMQDNSCQSRGVVNVTTFAKQVPKSVQIYQTNYYDKYDIIYQGYVDASIGPSVTLEPVSVNATVVAESVQFELVSTLGGLNGLYQYDGTVTDVEQFVTKAGIDLDDDAEIYALAVSNSTLFVGGTFTNSTNSNFFSLSNHGQISQIGLNETIRSLIVSGEKIIAGGDFGVKSWEQSWSQLLDVSAPVNRIVRVSLTIDGQDHSALLFNTGGDIPIYVEDSTSSADLPYLTGTVMSSGLLSNGSYLLAGNVSSQSLLAYGGAILSDLQLDRMPFTSTDSVIYTGTFYADSSYAIGGTFTTDTYENFMVFDADDTSGLKPGDLYSSTAITSLFNFENKTLIVGGAFNGVINNTFVNGVVIWDLTTHTLSLDQPPALSGEHVQVNAIVAQPGTDNIVVAGSFTRAGNVTCKNLCVYSLSSRLWTPVTDGVSGNISSLAFLDSNQLIVNGAMTTIDTVNCYMAMYDFSTQSWSTLGTQSATLPGPVDVFLTTSGSVDQAIVAGTYVDLDTSYLLAYKSGWKSLSSQLLNGTKIYDVQILSSPHSPNLLPRNTVLLVLGNLVFQDGNVSAAVFDGESWTPFLYAVTDTGSGVIYDMFTQVNEVIPSIYVTPSEKSVMKSGYVVLIALAISLVLIFIIVSLRVGVAYLLRRREGYELFPKVYDDLTQKIPPVLHE